MKELILEMKTYCRSHLFLLSAQQLINFEQRYQKILTLGYRYNLIEVSSKKKHRRQNLTKPLSILDRFRDYQKDVPFDNNLAEQNL